MGPSTSPWRSMGVWEHSRVLAAVGVHVAKQGACLCARTASCACWSTSGIVRKGRFPMVGATRGATTHRCPHKQTGLHVRTLPRRGAQAVSRTMPTRGHRLHAAPGALPITHHPLFSGRVVSDHQHHRAAASGKREWHSEDLA